jgi:dimethylargininase
MLDTPTRAVVRRFPNTYLTSYRRKGVDISPALALEQHRAYTQCLERSGVQVDHVPADDAFYDCVFVEDTAIVWGMGVLVTAMGAVDREGEQSAVRSYFARTHELFEMPAGATLEGGDVLHVEDVTYVGLSSRTNRAGAAALAQFMEKAGRAVIQVEVANALHLKTAVTYVGDGTVIAAPGCVDLDRFRDLDVMCIADGEAGAANCLRIGASLLMPSRNPATEQLVNGFASRHGLSVEVLDISEFEKGGGSLSCLSLLWRHESSQKR